MQIKFNFNNFARVWHSLAACQRHTPSSLAAVIGLSNNDVIALRALRWLETPLQSLNCTRFDLLPTCCIQRVVQQVVEQSQTNRTTSDYAKKIESLQQNWTTFSFSNKYTTNGL